MTRPVRLPAAEFAQRDLPLRAWAAGEMLRVHSAHFGAAFFSLNATHRYPHPGSPTAMMYGGEDLETCLWECFGDAVIDPGSMIARTVWDERRVSRIRPARTLRLVDLTELATRRVVGVDLSALKHPDLEVPQAWGRALAGHPAGADGIRFPSRFTGRPCVAWFERSAVGEIEVVGRLTKLEEAEAFLDTNEIALV